VKLQIIVIGMLPDMVNVVGKDIRNLLLQVELSVSFILSLNLAKHVIQKKTNCTTESDPSHKKTKVTKLMGPLESR